MQFIVFGLRSAGSAVLGLGFVAQDGVLGVFFRKVSHIQGQPPTLKAQPLYLDACKTSKSRNISTHISLYVCVYIILYYNILYYIIYNMYAWPV